MNKTSISWTTFSSNPLKYRRKSDGKTVWACVKESPGCAHCYSEAIALRYDRGKLFNAKNMEELEPFLDDAELRQLLTRKTCDGVQVEGSRVFVGDMTDLLGPWVPDEMLDRLFAVFALRPGVTFQVLTKHADRLRDYFGSGRVATDGASGSDRDAFARYRAVRVAAFSYGTELPAWDWPLLNLHLGVSIENKACADRRIPLLLQTPAAVRFLSMEPLLEAVQLRELHPDGKTMYCALRGIKTVNSTATYEHPHVDLVIVGGESGPKARPFSLRWARSLRDQCAAAGVSFFMKQYGSRPCVPSCATVACGHPDCDPGWIKLRDRSGADPAEWEEGLRVQEFPMAGNTKGA